MTYDENNAETMLTLPTTRRAAERRGMMRYCNVLVVSLTWPGMSLSLVKMHIFNLSFPLLLNLLLINVDPFWCNVASRVHTCVSSHSSILTTDL